MNHIFKIVELKITEHQILDHMSAQIRNLILPEGLSNNYPNQHINKTQYTNQNSEQDFNRQLNPNIYQDLQTENLMTDKLCLIVT